MKAGRLRRAKERLETLGRLRTGLAARVSGSKRPGSDRSIEDLDGLELDRGIEALDWARSILGRLVDRASDTIEGEHA